MTEWQPIETAPRDGTWILLSAKSLVWMGWFDDVTMDWVACGPTDLFRGIAVTDPVHWMPLPEPPK